MQPVDRPVYLPSLLYNRPRRTKSAPLPYAFYVHGQTDVGRVRERNEDSFALVPELGIAVVADGMGGRPGGDVASRIAVEVTVEGVSVALGQAASSGSFAEAMADRMRSIVMDAHDRIREQVDRDAALEGMGTTLTAIALDPTSEEWVVGHVGDSRAYRLREGGLTQLTRDDTWVQEEIDAGRMPPSASRYSPFAHLLTQCLGSDDRPEPQLVAGRSAPGDTFLLCTDGLVGMVEDDRVRTLLLRHITGNGQAEPGGAVEALIEAANEAGGRDNITAALIHVPPT